MSKQVTVFLVLDSKDGPILHEHVAVKTKKQYRIKFTSEERYNSDSGVFYYSTYGRRTYNIADDAAAETKLEAWLRYVERASEKIGNIDRTMTRLTEERNVLTQNRQAAEESAESLLEVI